MAKNTALDLYLWMLENIHLIQVGRTRQQMISAGNTDSSSANVDYDVLWARMQTARLFNVPTVLLEDIYDEVAGYVGAIVRLGQADELPSDLGTDLLIQEGCNHPFPERLPFEDILLLYPWAGLNADGSPCDPAMGDIASILSSGLVLDDEQLAFRYGPSVVPSLREHGVWSVVGHLASQDGQAWEFLRWTKMSLPGTSMVLQMDDLGRIPADSDIQISSGIAVTRLRDAEKWWSPLAMTPWALSSATHMINNCKSVAEKTKTSDRMTVQRWRKKKGLNVRPPMFYRILLQDNSTFAEAIQSQFPGSERQCNATFRSDVRGPERCRVRRGPLPMSERERSKLLSRGYTLYEEVGLGLSTEDESRLLERGLPLKEEGEWVALKTSWVDSYLKGPEDAPYRPAIRSLPVGAPTAEDRG